MSHARRTGRLAILTTLALALSSYLSAAVVPGKNPYPKDWFWGEPEQRAQQDSLIGKPLPKLDLTEWFNGEVKQADLKGKLVVIDLWATWCGPCVAAIPHNNEMMEKYKEQGVVVIGICGSSRGQEKMTDVLKARGAKYPNAKDHTGEVAKSFNLGWWPTYVVADREGIIRAVGMETGSVDKVVEAILAEEENAKSGGAAKKEVFEMEKNAPKNDAAAGKKEEGAKAEKKTE